MQQSIQHQVFYPHPPKRVWEYLTNPDLMELWLMKSDFKPVVGADFRFTARPIPDLQFDGIINCRVLEIIPFEKLVYSWTGGANGIINLNSIVTWNLIAEENGTTLKLLHTGFENVNVMMFTAMNDGWYRNMHKISTLLQTT